MLNINVLNLVINKFNRYTAPEVALCMLKNVYRSQVERCSADIFETAIFYLRCATDTVCWQLLPWQLFLQVCSSMHLIKEQLFPLTPRNIHCNWWYASNGTDHHDL